MILGIDTSNYTTSLALCDDAGHLVGDVRRVLEVRTGERGLRQSEAVFQHVRNLPELMDELSAAHPLAGNLKAIGVSVSPRPLEDSYMPVFRVGQGAGRMLGAADGLPVYAFSHQENHIRSAMAACVANRRDLDYPLLAVHFSGGTSEILLVTLKDRGFDCRIVGRSLDLNAGQLVDRIGVALGLGFPAGRELEGLARQAGDRGCVIPTRVEGGDFHFSGQENKARRLIETGEEPAAIAYGLFASIGRTLGRAIRHLAGRYGVRTVLFSGGVMANGIVRETAEKRLQGTHLDLRFADPRYATDNSVGDALLAWEAWSAEEGGGSDD